MTSGQRLLPNGSRRALPLTSLGSPPLRRCLPSGGGLPGHNCSSKQLLTVAVKAKMTVLGSEQLLSASREMRKLSGKLSACR